MDNLPIDVMVGRCRGPIIAVDVFPYRRAEGTNGNSVNHRRGFFRRLKPLAEQMPPLFDIMVRSTFVGSQHAVEGFLSSHPPALYLAPEVAKFGILEWGAYEALFQAGYACARRHLEAGALSPSLWEGPIQDAPP